MLVYATAARASVHTPMTLSAVFGTYEIRHAVGARAHSVIEVRSCGGYALEA
jgi:hypothetical protein